MTKFHWRVAAFFGAIAIIFLSLIGYVAAVEPKMSRDSKTALDTFYAQCRARNYAGAQSMLGKNLKDDLSVAQMATQWHKFEAKNGPLNHWKVADAVSIQGFGGSVCLFPPFVDYRHGVFGAKGTGTLIYIRMVPENGSWKIERFNVLR